MASEKVVPGSTFVVPLEDGTEGIVGEAEARFSKWLTDNGAKFPKIQWPARTTVGGVRGTIATGDIETNEIMYEIPEKLMITPPKCKDSPEIKHVYADNPFLFRNNDDRILVVFVMFERAKGDKSFWAPYFDILPAPTSIGEWAAEELYELQNPDLAEEGMDRNPRLKHTFKSLIPHLTEKYPDLFPEDKFTFELFKSSYMTIQARAFGRRLRWTALVPFADCLNHANVGIKYDFNVSLNGMFRMYPTAGNKYPKGSEVFNSYGRRDNRHLLLEYGFAIEDNEWASVAFKTCLPESEVRDKIRSIMFRFHISPEATYRLRWNRFNEELLSWYRLASLTEEEMANHEAIGTFYMKPLSPRNELAAIDAAIAGFKAWLDKQLTTVEADLKILDAKPPARLGVATAYRLTRKRIALQQIEWLEGIRGLVAVTAKMAPLRRGYSSVHPLPRYVESMTSTFVEEHYPKKPSAEEAAGGGGGGGGGAASKVAGQLSVEDLLRIMRSQARVTKSAPSVAEGDDDEDEDEDEDEEDGDDGDDE